MAYNPGFDPSIVDINGFSYKQTNNYLMTVIDQNWVPKYAQLNGLSDGSSITLDGSTQFSAFDQQVTIPINGSVSDFSYNVLALNPNTNSLFQLYWTSTPNPNYVAGSSTTFSLGYLNTYLQYETNITMGNASYHYSYGKKGAPVSASEVNFPSATVTVSNNELPTYSFSSTANPLINGSRWGGGTQTDPYKIDWMVYGPTSQVPVISEMPLVDFPDLDFANISLFSSRMYTQGDNYDVHTGRIFGDGTATTFNPVQEWFDYKQ
jgi:hypothetical protein